MSSAGGAEGGGGGGRVGRGTKRKLQVSYALHRVRIAKDIKQHVLVLQGQDGSRGGGGAGAGDSQHAAGGGAGAAAAAAGGGGKKSRGELSTPVLGPNAFPKEYPYNRDGYRYVLAEADPHAPFRTEFDEASDMAGKPIPGFLCRVLTPQTVLLSMHDRAPQVRDRLMPYSPLSVTFKPNLHFSFLRNRHCLLVLTF